MKLNQYLTLNELDTSSATNMELAIVQAWNLDKPKYPAFEPIAMNIIKTFISKGYQQGREKAEHLGDSSNFNVTKEWSQYGAKNPTPKTDFLIGNARVSLKKAGGSQLMSGNEQETRATFYAAIKQLHMDGSPVVDKIETFLHEFVKLKSPESVTGTRLHGGDITEKLISTELVHKEFGSFLANYFKNDPSFKQAVVHEAMSGVVKFGDKSKARAAYILVFDDKTGLNNKWHDIEDMSFISKKSNETKVSVAWKSQSRTSKTTGKEYSIYSTLRLGVTEERDRLVKEHEYLTEGIISDINQKVKDFFRKIWTKIRAWLSISIENVISFLGFEPDMIPITIKF